MTAPWDFTEARDACRKATMSQEAAESALREAAKEQAHAEESYRVALAKRIVELHADGVAWSVCGDIARGDKNVARLRMLRDISEGVRDAAVQACWRRNADRKDCQTFVAWSMRRELAEAGVGSGQPAWSAS